jgi:hypothetical protein
MSGQGSHREPPRYGEYATPEEQRARISHPVHDAPEAPAAPPGPAPTWGMPSAAHPVRTGHPVDRVITIALLVYGAVNVALSLVSFVDLPAVADMTYRVMGIAGTFTDTPAARVWGIVAAVVLVLGYAATAWLSVRTLRRGRWAWWIPLVGAIATYVIVSVCVSIPLMADPAFVEYLR